MACRLAYETQEVEEISRPQLVKPCRNPSRDNRNTDGELLLRYSVPHEANLSRPFRRRGQTDSFKATNHKQLQDADGREESIDLDPQDQGLGVCKALLSGVCIFAVLAAMIFAGIHFL